MNINDEIILLITKTPKDYFKKKEINLTSFNPNIKIFKKNFKEFFWRVFEEFL